ncbi:MAG: GvpL/GvpF family gas vesicle protein, partial [Solirubrobacterales bacterium]|nr:GvpL/GvpF family gas vesicle protein [Solirubrobacterales bacterium]
MSTEAPAQEPTYVYGVLRADQKAPERKGIAGAGLHEVSSGSIAALVSELRDTSLQFGREEMTTHVEVLEEARQQGTVLPMRFGVVMDGEPAVKEQLLEAHRAELEQQLEELADKVELRVRAVYEEETLLREVVSEDAEIARLRQELQAKSEDATYYARIRLGELVAGAMQRKRESDAMTILGALDPLAQATSVGDPPNERVAFTASFLVDQSRIGEFDNAVNEVARLQA